MTNSLKSCLKRPLEFSAAKFGEHRRIGSSALWIIMYHRILPNTDPRAKYEEPGMMVTPETFRMHLKQFKQFFEVMPLSEWVNRASNGLHLPTKACCITFDDGWADNYEYAFPLLEEEQLPATLFAVSAMAGSEKSFWPNRLAALLNNSSHELLDELDWLKQPMKSARLDKKVPRPHESSISREAFSAIVQQLKVYPDDIINNFLADAEQKYQKENADKIVPTQLPPSLMDWDHLRNVGKNPLFEIGSHTRHHCRLQQALNKETLQDEIVTSKFELQEKLDAPIDLFCYPNGDCSAEAVKMVKENYHAAVTTKKGLNRQENINLHKLNRIGLHEDISNTPTKLQARLGNWF